MQSDSIDLLFPSKAIEFLSKIRDEPWEKLITQLVNKEPNDPARVAFVLMMVRVGGCASCQSDSFRAMRGCILCASTTVKRYKGSDQSLIDLYNDAKNDVLKYMKEEEEYSG
jgi:hypothetical protein